MEQYNKGLKGNSYKDMPEVKELKELRSRSWSDEKEKQTWQTIYINF